MSRKNILIVDDDAINIFALSETLRAEGFNCLSSMDAEKAIEILNTDEIVDAVLIDMMMPGMDGYEAIPKIRQIRKRTSTPVIAVTALAMTGDKEKCIAAGATDYISKPVDVDKLLKLLSNIR